MSISSLASQARRGGVLLLLAGAVSVPAKAVVDSTDLDAIERQTIDRVLRESHGNKVHASRRLGISRMQLYGRLRKYGLETA